MITVTAALPTAVIVAVIGVPLVETPIAIGFGGAAWVGMMLSLIIHPDLDLAESWRPTGLGSRVWRMLWLAYGRQMPHRGWRSHLPIVGTLGRVAYLLRLPGPLWVVVSLEQLVGLPTLSWLALTIALAGLMWADTLHWVADACPLRI